MGNDTSVLPDLARTEWPEWPARRAAQQLPVHPAGGRTQMLAILTDAAVVRVALLAVGVSTFMLTVAAAL